MKEDSSEWSYWTKEFNAYDTFVHAVSGDICPQLLVPAACTSQQKAVLFHLLSATSIIVFNGDDFVCSGEIPVHPLFAFL